MRVKAHLKSVGRKDDLLERIVTRLSLEPSVTTIRWEVVSEIATGNDDMEGPTTIEEQSQA